MTNKELFRLATNEEALYYLDEIRRLNDNMIYKTAFEQRTALNKMRAAANVIRAILAESEAEK